MKLVNTKIILLVVSSFILGVFVKRAFEGNVDTQIHSEKVIKEKSELREKVLSAIKSKSIGIENHEADIIKMFLAYLDIKIENKNLRLLIKGNSSSSKEMPSLNQKKSESNLSSQESSALKEPNSFGSSNPHEQKTKIKSKNTSFKLSELVEIKKTKQWLTPIAAGSPKLYLENSRPFKQKNDLIEKTQGNLIGQIVLSNKEKLRIKIRSKLKYQNPNYIGTSYVEITDTQGTFLISSNENGKISNFRHEGNDEIPILIIKIRPHHFLRLKYHQKNNFFSGHMYSLDPNNKFYKLIGEIKQLRQK